MKRGTLQASCGPVLIFGFTMLVLPVLSGCDFSLEGLTADKQTLAAPQPATKPTEMHVVPESKEVVFKETGQALGGPFLTYWQEHGGVAVFGYPISESLAETADNGEQYTAKYFERARMELHPPAGSKGGLGRPGSLLNPAQRTAPALPDARYFQETGHNLSSPFLEFWTEHGGLDVFGYPITEVRTERSTGGPDFKVQYFERSKFELHATS